MNSSTLKLVSRLVSLLSWICMGLVLIMVVAHGLMFFQDVDRVPNIRHFLKFDALLEKPFAALIHASLPTKIGGRDITVFFAGLLLFFGSHGLSALAKRLDKRAGELKKEEDEKRRAEFDRAKLLEVYADAKSKLEKMKRPLAFLSIDVVDSTGMKKGEDPGVAEHDFRQYKQLVEKAFASNAVLKSTWTPDGVMACFKDAASAIKAGGAVIASLADFNAKVKKLRAEFRVRAGVNEGPVLYDEATPMEEMSDRVIDVAGHMQKYGATNVVSLPTAIAKNVKDLEFTMGAHVVDGYEVSEWTPLTAQNKKSTV